MTDDDYRALLARVGKVGSAADLDIAGRVRVLREFERLGWKPAPTGQPKPKLCREPQARKIRALWLALYGAGVVRNPDESALLTYVRRQEKVDRLEWLSVAAASKVIEALKQWCRRTGVEIEP
ncbi:MAG TPA: regulatory protein GemA [Rhodocyclaceae bacterium]|nr:regulatory protein GemA [Rhodocyclaceae bacterium]